MNRGHRETDRYVFFYGSVYSQWASVPMKINNIKYCTAEQYMMAEKARLFKDKNALKMIMVTSNPSIQKSWGKKVRNFDKNKWEIKAKNIVFEGNYAKFTQNPSLKDQLLSTGNKIIVEASPYDCIWGIGLDIQDNRILDPQKWRGTNWLGDAIMKVRTAIQKEEGK